MSLYERASTGRAACIDDDDDDKDDDDDDDDDNDYDDVDDDGDGNVIFFHLGVMEKSADSTPELCVYKLASSLPLKQRIWLTEPEKYT